MEKVNLAGLKRVLEKFDEDGKCVRGTHWKIANGGYDLWWELYYDEQPVVRCCASGEYTKNYWEIGNLSNCGTVPDTEFKRICKAIMDVYPECRVAEE